MPTSVSITGTGGITFQNLGSITFQNLPLPDLQSLLVRYVRAVQAGSDANVHSGTAIADFTTAWEAARKAVRPIIGQAGNTSISAIMSLDTQLYLYALEYFSYVNNE